MTELALKSTYSIQAVDRNKAKQIIASMFVNLQSQDKGGLTTAVAAGYLEAVEDIPEWALQEAVRLYRHAKLGEGIYAPLAGQLAKAARKLVTEKLRETKRQERLRKQFQEIHERKNIRSMVTPESKARVQRMLDKCKKNLAETELMEKSNV